jgi:hypothetical protein
LQPDDSIGFLPELLPRNQVLQIRRFGGLGGLTVVDALLSARRERVRALASNSTTLKV